MGCVYHPRFGSTPRCHVIIRRIHFLFIVDISSIFACFSFPWLLSWWRHEKSVPFSTVFLTMLLAVCYHWLTVSCLYPSANGAKAAAADAEGQHIIPWLLLMSTLPFRLYIAAPSVPWRTHKARWCHSIIYLSLRHHSLSRQSTEKQKGGIKHVKEHDKFLPRTTFCPRPTPRHYLS